MIVAYYRELVGKFMNQSRTEPIPLRPTLNVRHISSNVPKLDLEKIKKACTVESMVDKERNYNWNSQKEIITQY